MPVNGRIPKQLILMQNRFFGHEHFQKYIKIHHAINGRTCATTCKADGLAPRHGCGASPHWGAARRESADPAPRDAVPVALSVGQRAPRRVAMLRKDFACVAQEEAQRAN